MRTVLVLKEYGQLNYKEIGSILGITEGNVKVRVFRARERLLELLKGDEAECVLIVHSFLRISTERCPRRFVGEIEAAIQRSEVRADYEELRGC